MRYKTIFETDDCDFVKALERCVNDGWAVQFSGLAPASCDNDGGWYAILMRIERNDG